MARTKKAKHSSGSLPLWVRISRGVLAAQSVATSCLGAIGVLVATLSLGAGTQWLPFVAATFGVSAVALGAAFGLWKLKSMLTRIPDRWMLVTIATETVLFSIGVALFELIGRAPQPSQGTDGAFADGGAGALGLVAYAYVAGVLVVVLLTLNRVWQVPSRHRT
jgi:hypothetical protein